MHAELARSAYREIEARLKSAEAALPEKQRLSGSILPEKSDFLTI